MNISNVDSAGSSISFDVSLQPAAFVRLDTPAVHANFEVGSLQTISWQQGQVASVDLGYSTDTGATWRDIATGLTGHGYAWHVPNTPSRRCVLRIRDSADPGYQHTIPFSISDSKAFYPLVFNYDLSQSHCNFNTAVVCRNDTFWVARWNQNYVARFATDGTYIDSLTIRGTAAGLYSMTYDSRRWFYGVPYGSGYGNHMIYKIDPATWSVVDSIATPAFAQACAYDSTADKHRGGLWVALSDLPVTLIDLQGKVLKQIYSHGLDFISGVAVDHASTGGPYLWLFVSGANLIPHQN